MITSYGWIKLYRTLLDSPLWQNSTAEQKVILITLLLTANHAQRQWEWQGKPYTCKPGQMITSLNSIQERVGKCISLFQIRYALKRFESMGFLLIETSKHGRLITVCNWERYQTTDETVHSPVVRNVSDSSQDGHTIVTPNKNDKNVKNEKKDARCFSSLSFEQQDIRRAADANGQALSAFMEATAEK